MTKQDTSRKSVERFDQRRLSNKGYNKNNQAQGGGLTPNSFLTEVTDVPRAMEMPI